MAALSSERQAKANLRRPRGVRSDDLKKIHRVLRSGRIAEVGAIQQD
jgi:hypothetical protein